MALKYWYGGSGNWNSGTAHWSLNSGNSPSSTTTTPTASDDIVFDANSGTGTMTINVTAACNNATFAGTSLLTIAGTSGITFSGNLTMASGMTWSHSGTKTFNATSTGKTITFASNTMNGNITFNGTGGGWTLQDNLSMATKTITVTRGTVDFNGKIITCGTFSSSNTGVRSLIFGSGTLNCSSIILTTKTNLTFSAASSTIKVTSSTVQFSSGGLTFGTVTLTSGVDGRIFITGANTFSNLTIDFSSASGTNLYASFVAGLANTISGTLTVTGHTTHRGSICSTTTGTATTISAGTVTGSYANFYDVTATGASSWDISAITGGSSNMGGNTGITFTNPITCYWHEGSGNYTDSKWYSATNGGGSATRVPLFQDNAVFDQNSFDSTGKTITMNVLMSGKLDFSSATNSPTLSFSGIGAYTNGFPTLASGMAISNSSTLILRVLADNVIDTKGISFGAGVMDFYGGNYNISLGSDLFVGSWLYLRSYLTFDLNDYNFTSTGAGIYDFDTKARTMRLGNGDISLSNFAFQSITNLTFYSESSTLILEKPETAIALRGLTWNNIYINTTGERALLSGAGTINELRIGEASNALLFSSSSVTVSSIVSEGTSGLYSTSSFQYEEANTYESLYSGSVVGVAVSPQTSLALKVTSASFYLSKAGSPTGNVYAKIYDLYSGFNLLATSAPLDVSTLTTTATEKEFLFSGDDLITIISSLGTHAVALEYSDGDSSNYLKVEKDDEFLSDQNTHYSLTGDTWTDVVAQYKYKISYTISNSAVLSSGTIPTETHSITSINAIALGQYIIIRNSLATGTFSAIGGEDAGGNTGWTFVSTTNIKTLNGVAIDNIKSINGVMKSDINLINGIE